MGRCQVGPSVMAHGGRFGVGQQVSEHWHVLKWMRDMQLCLVRVSDEAGNYPRLVLSNLFLLLWLQADTLATSWLLCFL